MTLEEISYVGQAVAAIAVLVSLAAVYGQLQQNNKIARADLTHSIWLSAGAMNLSLYDTPEKAELMHRALYSTGPLTEIEKLQMRSVIGVALGVHEAAFNAHKRGLMEDGAYSTLESSDEEIIDVFRINAIAPLHLSRFAIPHMQNVGGGAIVNISSGMAILADYGGVAYGAAKAALEQITNMMALEFAPKIRVNAIRSGSIRTSMLEDGLFRANPEMESEILRWTPGARLGTPRDIAAAATFLCSDAAPYITGAILDVDGGLNAPKSPLALSAMANQKLTSW